MSTHRLAIAIVCGIAAAAAEGCSRSDATARYLASGDRRAAAHDDAGAAIEYRNAIKRSPASVEAHVKLAEAAGRLHDPTTRTTELIAIARLLPDDVAAQLRAGTAALQTGRSSDARSAFEAALAHDPAEPTANRAVAALLVAEGRAGDAEPFARALAESPRGDPFALADFYFARKKFPDAERELRALAASGDDARREQAQLRLAAVLHAGGRREQAQQTIDGMLRRGRQPAAWLLRARMLAADRRLDEAAAAYAKALAADPASFAALSELTAVEVAAGRPQEAIARLERRLSKTPDDGPLLLLASRAYLAARQPDRAERALAHAIETGPDNLDAYALLGQQYLHEGRLDAARDEFEAIAARASDAVGAKTMAAMIDEAKGRRAEAQARYEAILQSTPRAGVAANNLAWLYLRGGRLDDALRYAAVAKASLPQSPQASDTLGWAHYVKGQARDAIPLLAECVDRDPANPLYRFHLGMAYAKADMPAQAREELQRALDSATPFDERADAERAVGMLSATR